MGILRQEGIKIQTINSQSQALSNQNFFCFQNPKVLRDAHLLMSDIPFFGTLHA